MPFVFPNTTPSIGVITVFNFMSAGKIIPAEKGNCFYVFIVIPAFEVEFIFIGIDHWGYKKIILYKIEK